VENEIYDPSLMGSSWETMYCCNDDNVKIRYPYKLAFDKRGKAAQFKGELPVLLTNVGVNNELRQVDQRPGPGKILGTDKQLSF